MSVTYESTRRALTVIMVDELQEIAKRFLRADEDAAAIELANFIMLDGDFASRDVVVAYRQNISHFVCNATPHYCTSKHKKHAVDCENVQK